MKEVGFLMFCFTLTKSESNQKHFSHHGIGKDENDGTVKNRAMYMNFYQSGNDGRIQFNQWSSQDGRPEPPIWPLQPTEPPFRPIQPPPIQPPFRPMPPVQPPIMPPMPGVQNWRGNDAAGRHVEIDWGSLGDGHDGAMEQNGGLGSEGRDWGGNGAGWSGNGADRSGNGARWNGKAGSNAGNRGELSEEWNGKGGWR